MKIYLDTCCFNRPYDDQTSLRISLETQAKLQIQHLVRKGQVQLATSYILFYENRQNPYDVRRRAIQSFCARHSSLYIGSEYSEDVLQRAGVIMTTGIKTKDACHIACAEIAGCDYMLSTDDRLLKYKYSQVILANPVEFIRLEVESNESKHS